MIGEYVVDSGPLPVWARNLAYRLLCLQCPEDPTLLREAGIDLYLHGVGGHGKIPVGGQVDPCGRPRVLALALIL
jgi:hypothetical protein